MVFKAQCYHPERGRVDWEIGIDEILEHAEDAGMDQDELKAQLANLGVEDDGIILPATNRFLETDIFVPEG